ncbi:MAG: DUF4157 domain-containing protein [Anaerolineae bacterium]
MSEPQHQVKPKPDQIGRRVEKTEPSAPEQASERAPIPFAPRRALNDPRTLSPQNLLALQRLVGNRAVRRLIQRKLMVGAAHDAYEQEADRVADQVLRAPQADAGPAVQRVGEKEHPAQPKPLADVITPPAQRAAQEKDEEVQTKRDDPLGSFETSGDFQQRLEATRGGGSSLPGETRGVMESRFGADFGNVRVHTGGESAQLNREVSAQAFTHGSDIYLGAGKEDVQSSAGQHLLAHELTHVVQQGHAQPQTPQAKLIVGAASDPFEQEADRVADQVTAGVPSLPATMHTAQPVAQRDGEEEGALSRREFDLGLLGKIEGQPGTVNGKPGHVIDHRFAELALPARRGGTPLLTGRNVRLTAQHDGHAYTQATLEGSLLAALPGVNQDRPLRGTTRVELRDTALAILWVLAEEAILGSAIKLTEIKLPIHTQTGLEKPALVGTFTPPAIQSVAPKLSLEASSAMIGAKADLGPIGKNVQSGKIKLVHDSGATSLHGALRFHQPIQSDGDFEFVSAPNSKELVLKSTSPTKIKSFLDWFRLGSFELIPNRNFLAAGATYNTVGDELDGNLASWVNLGPLGEVEGNLSLAANKLSGTYALTSHAAQFPARPAEPILIGVIQGGITIKEDVLEKTTLGGTGQFHVPGLKFESPEIKLAVDFSPKLDVHAMATVMKTIEVGKLLDIEALTAEHRENKFSLHGVAHVKGIVGVKPFDAPMSYTQEQGVAIRAHKIDIEFPKVAGTDARAELEDVEYVSKEGGFSGKGKLVGQFGLLGKTTSEAVLQKSRLQEAQLKFEGNEIKFPATSPFVIGTPSGELLYKEGKWENSKVIVHGTLLQPGKGESREGRAFEVSAGIEGGEFKTSGRLGEPFKLAQFAEVKELEVKTAEGGKPMAEGALAVTGIQGVEDVQKFTLSDAKNGLKDVLKGKTYRFGREREGIWGQAKLSLDLFKGIDVRGEANVALTPQTVISGQLQYDPTQGLVGQGEMGDLKLMNQHSTPDMPVWTFDKDNRTTIMGQKLRGEKRLWGAFGVFGEMGGKVTIALSAGPVTLDADAHLKNLDLMKLHADLDPLDVDLKGGVRAEVKGFPYLLFGAFFGKADLLNVSGGLRFAPAVKGGADFVRRYKNIKYTAGKGYEPPELSLPLALVLGGKIGFEPIIAISALKGWFEKNLVTLERSEKAWPPRKVFEWTPGLKTAGQDKNLQENVKSLDKAPEASGGVAAAVSVGEGPKIEATEAGEQTSNFVPTAFVAATPEAPEGGDAPDPIGFRDIIGGVRGIFGGIPWIDSVMRAANTFEKIAAKIGASVDAVLDTLDSLGLLGWINAGVDRLNAFSDKVEEAAELTLTSLGSLVLRLLGKESEGALEAPEGEKPPERREGEVGEGPLFVRYQLVLGASSIYVEADKAGQGQIAENKLAEKGGLNLKKAVKLELDEARKIERGELEGSLAFGDWGVLQNLKLEIGKGGKVTPEFVGATVEPTRKFIETFTEAPPALAGSFENTVFRVWKLNLKHQTTASIPDPLNKGKSLALSVPMDLSFERKGENWVFARRGVSAAIEGVGSVSGEVLDYAVGEAGVSAKGKLNIEVDKLGRATALMELVDNKFKALEFAYQSKRFQMPTENPFISGMLDGNLIVEDAKFKNADINADLQVHTAYLNEGQPFALKSNVRILPNWVFEVSTLEPIKKVVLKKDYLSVENLAFKRSGGGEVEFTGKGQAWLPYLETVEAVFAYKGDKFSLVTPGKVGKSPFTVEGFEVAGDERGWRMGGLALIENIPTVGPLKARLYLGRQKLGLGFEGQDGMAPLNLPGVAGKAKFAWLEYEEGAFNAAGDVAVKFPIGGSAASAFKMTKSKIAEAKLQLKSGEQIGIPTQDPFVKGTYSGGAVYGNNKLAVDMAGKMDFDLSRLGSKEKPKLDFKLGYDSVAGLVGEVKGAGRIGSYLALEDFRLALEPKEVQKNIQEGQQQPPSEPKTEVGSGDKAPTAEFERVLKGGGLLKVDFGEHGGGGIGLLYEDKKFKFLKGTVKVKGERFKGEGSASYSTDDGLELDMQAEAQLSEGEDGIKAKGRMTYGKAKGGEKQSGEQEKGKGDDPKQGRLAIEPFHVLKPKDVYTKTLFDYPGLTFPVASIGLGSIYGKAGAKGEFAFGSQGVQLGGEVGLTNVDFKKNTYDEAYAFLDVKGGIRAELRGGPSLGVGAMILTDGFASVEGGANFMLKGMAALKANSRVTVVYDQSRKPKGNFKLDLPLILELRAQAEPYVKYNVLFGLLKDEKPYSKLPEVQVMKPKELLKLPIEFGNLKPGAPKELDKLTPSKSDLKDTTDKPTQDEPVQEVTKPWERVPTEKGEPGTTLPNTDPIELSHVLNRIKDRLKPLGQMIQRQWERVKAIGQRIGNMAASAARALREGASTWGGWLMSMVQYGIKGLDSFINALEEGAQIRNKPQEAAEWVRDQRHSDIDGVKQNVDSAKELKDIDKYQELPSMQRVGTVLGGAVTAGILGGLVAGPPGAIIGGLLGGVYATFMTGPEAPKSEPKSGGEVSKSEPKREGVIPESLLRDLGRGDSRPLKMSGFPKSSLYSAMLSPDFFDEPRGHLPGMLGFPGSDLPHSEPKSEDVVPRPKLKSKGMTSSGGLKGRRRLKYGKKRLDKIPSSLKKPVSIHMPEVPSKTPEVPSKPVSIHMPEVPSKTPVVPKLSPYSAMYLGGIHSPGLLGGLPGQHPGRLGFSGSVLHPNLFPMKPPVQSPEFGMASVLVMGMMLQSIKQQKESEKDELGEDDLPVVDDSSLLDDDLPEMDEDERPPKPRVRSYTELE